MSKNYEERALSHNIRVLSYFSGINPLSDKLSFYKLVRYDVWVLRDGAYYCEFRPQKDNSGNHFLDFPLLKDVENPLLASEIIIWHKLSNRYGGTLTESENIRRFITFTLTRNLAKEGPFEVGPGCKISSSSYSPKNGPAIMHTKDVIWYLDDMIHREDGPAAIYLNGKNEYYLYGHKFNSQKDWFSSVTDIHLG